MKVRPRLVLIVIMTWGGFPGAVLHANSDKAEEAKQLVEHARQLSDIRSQGAPAFQLRSKLRFLDGAMPVEGSYVETWASPSQWRTEIVKGDQTSTAVVNGRKYWFLGDEQAPHRRAPFTLQAGDGGFRINRFALFGEGSNSVRKIRDRQSGDVAMRCLESGDHGGPKSELCFAESTGRLVESVGTLKVRDRWVDATCTYANYQEYLGKSVPKTIRCFEDRKPVYEEDIEEVSRLPEIERTLFEPLKDAEESTYCYAAPTPPRPIRAPDPGPPKTGGRQQVILVILVGPDGIPRNLRVQRPASDSEFTKEAVAAVREWRFRPAQCDGEPFEAQINVEVNSELR